MGKTYRCSVCGASFYDDPGLGGYLVQELGVDFGKKVCPDCKRAQKIGGGGGSGGSAEASTVRVKTGPGVGSILAQGAMDSLKGSFDRANQVMNDVKEEKSKRESTLQQITSMQFPIENPEEIQQQLSTLFTLFEQYKPKFSISTMGLDKGPSEKVIRAAIKEKIEFGVMKLQSAGKTAEADFFQKKMDKLK